MHFFITKQQSNTSIIATDILLCLQSNQAEVLSNFNLNKISWKYQKKPIVIAKKATHIILRYLPFTPYRNTIHTYIYITEKKKHISWNTTEEAYEE